MFYSVFYFLFTSCEIMVVPMERKYEGWRPVDTESSETCGREIGREQMGTRFQGQMESWNYGMAGSPTTCDGLPHGCPSTANAAPCWCAWECSQPRPTYLCLGPCTLLGEQKEPAGCWLPSSPALGCCGHLGREAANGSTHSFIHSFILSLSISTR